MAHFSKAGAVECQVLKRDDVRPGVAVDGPAIVESMDSTILIPPGWRAVTETKGYIIMEATGDG